MTSPEHLYTAYPRGEKPAPPGVIARTYSNLPSLEMSPMVFPVVANADLKQLEISRVWYKYGKTGSCKTRAQFAFGSTFVSLQWCDFAPPNGLDDESATNNHDHRVYGHMPNSLM